jgi:phenylacetic acid degradation operon negative regulatory protein
MTQQSKRPFTARSVLASTLLGADPPELPVAHLVRVSSLFGINENRARVALSRMVATGEASSDGAGHYRLAGHLLDRQRRQSASRAGRTRAWRGDWHVVVLTSPGGAAASRSRRRRRLAFARLAELREGTWLRPDNLGVVLPDLLADDVVLLTTRVTDAPALAARLWDLGTWATRAGELLAALAARAPSGPEDLAPGFVLSAAVLRHLQADPLLPPALLPPTWPGEHLRRRYDDWDARYRRVLAEWSRSSGGP